MNENEVKHVVKRLLNKTRMDLFKIIRLVVLILSFSLTIYGGPGCLMVDSFYDRVTGSCAPCSDICDHALLQGTADQCNKECPGYNSNNLNGGRSPGDGKSGPKSWKIYSPIVIGFIVVGLISLAIDHRYIRSDKSAPYARTWRRRLCGIGIGTETADGENESDTDVKVPLDGANGMDDVELADIPLETQGTQPVQNPEEIPRTQSNPIQQPIDDNGTAAFLPS